MEITHGMIRVLRMIDEEAVKLGIRAGPGEVIGFIPRKAYRMAPGFFDRAANFDESRVIENRLEGAN